MDNLAIHDDAEDDTWEAEAGGTDMDRRFGTGARTMDGGMAGGSMMGHEEGGDGGFDGAGGGGGGFGGGGYEEVGGDDMDEEDMSDL